MAVPPRAAVVGQGVGRVGRRGVARRVARGVAQRVAVGRVGGVQGLTSLWWHE